MKHFITDHRYIGLHHSEAICEKDGCSAVMARHIKVGETRLEPHGWLGRPSEGGSNTPCAEDGCGALRLAKVHIGMKPKYLETPPVTEAVNDTEDEEFDEEFGEDEDDEEEEAPVRLREPRLSRIARVTVAEEEALKLLRTGDYEVAHKATQDNVEMRSPTEVAWEHYSARVSENLKAKAAYGSAWQDVGYMGNLARVLLKASRLKNMLWRDSPWLGTGGEESQTEQESVSDTLLDIGPLAAFMFSNVHEDNRWGNGS